MPAPRTMYRLLSVLLLGSALPAQTGSTTKPTTEPANGFEAFVRAVDSAHRKSDNERDYDRFDGRISIVPLTKEADRVEVKLRVKFLGPKLLRYETSEGGRTLERGQDAKGGWMRKGEKVVSLGQRDLAADRKALRQHIRLARQLLNFLDPAETLRKLEEHGKVESKPLKRGRRDPVECDYVRGILGSFPMFHSAGETTKVRLELWTKDGLLQALRATPVDEKDKAVGAPEMVLLDDYVWSADVQVPTLLTILNVGEAPKKPTSAVKIVIESLDLDPELDEKSFTRPK